MNETGIISLLGIEMFKFEDYDTLEGCDQFYNVKWLLADMMKYDNLIVTVASDGAIEIYRGDRILISGFITNISKDFREHLVKSFVDIK